MQNENDSLEISDELIINKILIIRNQKVMLDIDLASLYEVTTKRLNEQVKRNINRFPADFMFQLTEPEKARVVANCDHLKNLKYSPHLPFAFTEHGAVMLAGVLNSNRAIAVNIQIIRIFTKLRELMLSNKEILLKLEQLEKQVFQNTGDIAIVFETLKHLLSVQPLQREPIGFKIHRKS